MEKDIKTKALKAQWKDLCNIYLEEFCKRHEYAYEPDMWIGGEPGTIVEVCDMCISMDDIRYDVDNDIETELFERWYWKCLDIYELTGQKYMNYANYCKGAPDHWTRERLDSIREAKKRVELAQKDLEDKIKDCIENGNY